MNNILFFLVIILFQLQNIDASTIKINDINNALNKSEISKLTMIMNKEINFHKQHMTLPHKITYNLRICNKAQLKKYKKLQSNLYLGIFNYATNEAIIKKGSHFFRTTVHESNHYIMRLGFKNPPNWIDEGLAEYFETAYISNGDVFVRIHADNRKRLQNWYKNGEIPPLASVLSWSSVFWRHLDSKASRDFKSRKIAWGLIYFLMNSKENRQSLHKIIKVLKNNHNKNIVMIIQSNYIGGFSKFQKDFFSFLQKMPNKQKLLF